MEDLGRLTTMRKYIVSSSRDVLSAKQPGKGFKTKPLLAHITHQREVSTEKSPESNSHARTATAAVRHSPPVVFSHVLAETYQLFPVPVPPIFLGNSEVTHVGLPLLRRLLQGKVQRRGQTTQDKVRVRTGSIFEARSTVVKVRVQ